MDAKLEEYWTKRYKEERTGWDIGYPSTPLKAYIDQIENKDLRILIPGAGNAYEAQYLHENGFQNVFVLDISPFPLDQFSSKNPAFPSSHLIQGDFFAHEGDYDLIFEQTFFCSFEPSKENRTAYAEKMASLLSKNGLLVGVWFDIPLIPNSEKRPFGGSKEEYLVYLEPYFETLVFESCYNSIPPRMGNELFGILKKK